MRSGRPLQFLGIVVGGWIAARTALLWPDAGIVPALVRAVAPAAAAETTPDFGAPQVVRRIPPGPTAHAVEPARAAPIGTMVPGMTAALQPPRGSVSTGGTGAAIPAAALPPEPTPAGVDPPPAFTASRWSGSAWAILRPDGRATPFASQLGGSQAGVRLAYAVDAHRRVALYARASTAIDARQREAAVGFDWRPTRLPLHLVAERRIGIEGVRGGFAVGAIGGVGPTRLAGPIRIEGYAQAGVIFRGGREGFADGSLRLTATAAKRVDLGLGAWGGAQRDAARLDVGPTLGLTVPVARHALRVSADWRQRVAGDARPGSGPALSLGVDF